MFFFIPKNLNGVMHYLVQMSPENYLNGVWYDDFPSDYVNGDVPCIFFPC